MPRPLFMGQSMSLHDQWHAIFADLRGKLHRRDWHGVRDACVDLELIEREMIVRGIELPVRL